MLRKLSTIEGESWDGQSGAVNATIAGASGGRVAGNLGNGDSVTYNRVNFAGRNPNMVTFQYSSARPTNTAFTLEFHAGSATGPVIAAPGLLGTGSDSTFKQISFNVSNLPAGTTTITVVEKSSDSYNTNLDYFKLV